MSVHSAQVFTLFCGCVALETAIYPLPPMPIRHIQKLAAHVSKSFSGEGPRLAIQGKYTVLK